MAENDGCKIYIPPGNGALLGRRSASAHTESPRGQRGHPKAGADNAWNLTGCLKLGGWALLPSGVEAGRYAFEALREIPPGPQGNSFTAEQTRASFLVSLHRPASRPIEGGSRGAGGNFSDGRLLSARFMEITHVSGSDDSRNRLHVPGLSSEGIGSGFPPVEKTVGLRYCAGYHRMGWPYSERCPT